MANTRRGFLKWATAAMGGLMACILGFPLVRYLLYPAGRQTVTSPDQPIDTIAVTELPKDGSPKRVTIVADGVRDGWGTTRGVALGAAWIRRQEDGSVLALSTVCPHLGCSIGYDAPSGEFQCPCHKSAFRADGSRRIGPSKRGMDPLPLVIEDGRIKIRYVRFRTDIAEREPIG